MCSEDKGGRVISPSSSTSPEDPNSVGVSFPRSYVGRRTALFVCSRSVSFYVRIFSLKERLTSCLDVSSGRLASHGSLWVPLRPCARL
jgi:hypothetical protein